MDRFRTVRNVAIVLALGAAVDLLPQGGTAAHTFGAVLAVAFAGGLAFFAGRMYLEHRVAIYGLGDRSRGMLYVAVAVGVVTVTAQPRMFLSAAGEFAWFLIMGAVVVVLVQTFRSSRSY